MDKLILSSTDIIQFGLFSNNKKLGWPMKKGTGIGVGVAVVVVAIIFGIASLPDEVLIESPSIEPLEGPAAEEKKVVPSESITSIEQTEPQEVEPPIEQVEETEPEEVEPPIEQVEETEPEEETEGKVIQVKIRDGVGSGDR